MRPVDVTKLDDWEIYYEDASWPSSPGRRFIASAAEAALHVKWGLRGRDIALDDEPNSYRDEVAASLAGLLMSGALVADSKPIGGERVTQVPAAEWTPATAVAAVRRGYLMRPQGSVRATPHWVFVGVKEAELMELVYRWTEMVFPPEDWSTTENIGSVVLGSLSAIARNPAAIAPQPSADGILKLLLPHSNWALHPKDMPRFIAAMVPWLVAQFDADVANARTKDDFERQALAELAPFVTKRVFDRVWSATRKKAKTKPGSQAAQPPAAPPAAVTPPAQPDLSGHLHYFTRGRKTRSKAA